jgi:hypothetical protein
MERWRPRRLARRRLAAVAGHARVLQQETCAMKGDFDANREM